jgi:hypothetical protein
MLTRFRNLSDIWPTDLAILEIDPLDGELLSAFQESGYTNILGVVAGQTELSAVAAKLPAIGNRLAVYHAPKIVRQNNAAAIILHRNVARNIVLFRPMRHARFVAWEFRLTLPCLLAVLAGVVQWLLRKLKWPILMKVHAKHDGTTARVSRLIVFPLRAPRPHDKVRRFIPHRHQVDGFLRNLVAANIPHAVLRWFESLPTIEPGEDIDLLVGDKQLNRVREILSSGIGIQPIDLYSVSGQEGSDFRGQPYLPPHFAEELLERAQLQRNLCRVPALREHFLSLAYHAVYHKGYDSGLASCDVSKPVRGSAEHNYHAVLSELADRLGVDVPITLDDLDFHLAIQGWRPPRETLQLLARHNSWLQSRLNGPLLATSTPRSMRSDGPQAAAPAHAKRHKSANR